MQKCVSKNGASGKRFKYSQMKMSRTGWWKKVQKLLVVDAIITCAATGGTRAAITAISKIAHTLTQVSFGMIKSEVTDNAQDFLLRCA